MMISKKILYGTLFIVLIIIGIIFFFNNHSDKKIGIQEKKITYCYVSDPWNGEEKCDERIIEGDFPLDTKEKAEYVLKQIRKEAKIEEIVDCQNMVDKKCWFYEEEYLSTSEGVTYGYWFSGKMNMETGRIDETVSHTSP